MPKVSMMAKRTILEQAFFVDMKIMGMKVVPVADESIICGMSDCDAIAYRIYEGGGADEVIVCKSHHESFVEALGTQRIAIWRKRRTRKKESKAIALAKEKRKQMTIERRRKQKRDTMRKRLGIPKEKWRVKD